MRVPAANARPFQERAGSISFLLQCSFPFLVCFFSPSLYFFLLSLPSKNISGFFLYFFVFPVFFSYYSGLAGSP